MTPNVGSSSSSAAIQRFVQLLDKRGLVSLLDTFLTYETLPQTQNSLKELTELDQGTVSRRVNELVNLGIVEEIDDTRPQEYRLDMDHPAAPGLVETHTELHDYVREIHSESEEFDAEQAAPHEGSPFVELFRYRTNVKILTAFLRFPEERFRIRDISDKAEVDVSTVIDNIDVLCRVGIVQRVESRLRDNTEYVLNNDHPAKQGFQRVIESLQSDEPMTPVDKDKISTPTSGNRVEGVRQQLAELLEGSITVDSGLEATEEWTQDLRDAMETYSLQLSAGNLTAETDSANAADRQSTPESESDEVSVKDCVYCELDGRGMNGTGYHGPEPTNATAA